MDLRQSALESLEMTATTNPDADFWRGRRVLLTGHTGFKGAWLALWLHRLGARVCGIGLSPETTPNLFSLVGIDVLVDSRITDIRDASALATLVNEFKPEIVIHMAAQALVRKSYREPLVTFETNVQGTANLLEAIRATGTTRVVVAITTDKVYCNLEQSYPYRETDALGGHDPYSASKAAAEMVIASYRDSFLAEDGIAVASARAGNVIGGGDWSDDRLVPDIVRAWNSGSVLNIRRPQAIRPWQHALEPLAGYLKLAEQLWERPNLAGAYNFGPYTHEAITVRELISLAREIWGYGEVNLEMGEEGPHETGWLALEIARASHVLGITPRWSVLEALRRSIIWYQCQLNGIGARELCIGDIDAYEADVDKAPVRKIVSR